MSDQEDCTICLELLFTHPKTTITRLQPCQHHYHTTCIHAWREKSNSCPTCRLDYDVVELINVERAVVSRTTVEKVDVPIIEEYFEENLEIRQDYIEDESRLDQRLDFMLSNSNTCVLCDDPVTTTSNSLTSCVGCSSCFHVNCLGLSMLTYWCCPLCDAENVNHHQSRVSVFRRNRNSARTNRVYNSNRRNLLEIIQKASANQMNEQLQAQPQVEVSPEVERAWIGFDVARRDVVEREIPLPAPDLMEAVTVDVPQLQQLNYLPRIPVSVPSPIASSSTKGTTVEGRKFKQPSRRNRNRNQQQSRSPTEQTTSPKISRTSSITSVSSTAPVRQTAVVSTLVQQMKSNRAQSNTTIPFPPRSLHLNTQQTSPQSSSMSEDSSPMTISPVSSTPTATSSTESLPQYTPLSSSFTTDFQSKKYWKEPDYQPHQLSTNANIITNGQLNLQQKQWLRNVVRDVLQPYYIDKLLTEEQYTDVNRKISHKLYGLSIEKGMVLQGEEASGLVKEEVKGLGL